MARADPSAEISVKPAKPVPVHLVVAIETDPAYDGAAVEAAMIAALTDALSGILSHGNVPIGGSIFLSALFQAVLAVPGLSAIGNLIVAINGGAATQAPFALTAPEGTFLDFLPFDNR